MKRILLTSMLAISVSACTVTPKPLTTGSLSSFASDKLSRVTAGQQAITKQVTLYEAMARALKYNLDFHVELYNEALANKALDSARLDTLPRLVASAAYTGRNNNAGSAGSTIFPDREKFQEDISLSWNILDFGLSKIRAEQAADEVLIARERRRKIINRVIEDVRTAYWRAVSADRLVVGLSSIGRPCTKGIEKFNSFAKRWPDFAFDCTYISARTGGNSATYSTAAKRLVAGKNAVGCIDECSPWRKFQTGSTKAACHQYQLKNDQR